MKWRGGSIVAFGVCLCFAVVAFALEEGADFRGHRLVLLLRSMKK